MFTLREIAVSLTFFVLLYSLLSATVAVSWRLLRLLRASKNSVAGLLFILRIFPLVASIVITLAFVVPSFQLLEPRSIDEGMGTMPLALGICALLLIACGCYRVITAQTTTSRVVSRWLQGARPIDVDATPLTMTSRSSCEAPPLTLVGVRKPRVLVSESTLALLSDDELHIALKHELAHMQSCDNLKKLIFRFCPFPGMDKLEKSWSQAVELASALVKLSRLVPVEAAPICTVGFVTGTIGARVARLLAWDQASKFQPVRIRPWYVDRKSVV